MNDNRTDRYVCPNCGSFRVVSERVYQDGTKVKFKINSGIILTCVDCGYDWFEDKIKIDIAKDKKEHEKFNDLGRITENDKIDLRIDLEQFGKEK